MRLSEHSPRKSRSGKLDRTFAARHLASEKDRILSLWEAEVRRQIPESQDKSSLVLSNTLPLFLDELVKVLMQEHPETRMIDMGGMSTLHGADRAGMFGYFIPQLLLEFSILRQVINEELFAFESLSFEVPMTVDKVIDSAISLATTEFVRVHGEGTKTALAKAETSNQELEEFAAVAAHDLKSPLATVIGFLELLNEKIHPPKGSDDSKNIEFMAAALKRMTALIDHLLEYAHIGSRNHQFQPVHLSDVLATATENLRDSIGKNGVQIECDSLPTVAGNGQLLTQVFQNIIANAIKFHGKEPLVIRISSENLGDFYTVKVSDNGIGFDPKFSNQIFELYKRLQTRDQTSGTGIGLATCRKVIELHGGRIWAESEPGKGSSFYFTFPKLAADAKTH